jgi:hypothetical protein
VKHVTASTKTIETAEEAYLRLSRSRLIVAIRGGAKGSARSVLTGANSSSLGQVLLTLRLSDLNLLLFTTTSELLRLEGVLCLELSSAMLGDVSLSHGGSCVGSIFCEVMAMCGGGMKMRKGEKDAQASTGDEGRGFIDVLDGEQVVGRGKGVNARIHTRIFL